MQPFSYLISPVGMIWVILCLPLGFALTAVGYCIINRIPAKWLCDYNETPSEELLTGKRVKYLPSGIPVSLLMTACLVLCRLQFNKGYDIYFCVLSLILFDCLLIAIADIKYQIIPDQFTIILGILAIMISVYDIVRGYNILHSAWWSPLAGAGIGAGTMLLVDFIGMLVYKRDGMGFGDVKLFLAGGILTGFPGTVTAFIIAIVTATVFFVAIIIISKIIHGGHSAEPGNENEDIDKEQTSSEVLSSGEGVSLTEADDTGEESAADEDEDESIGFGSYLAFGPYLVAAFALYVVLFDLVKFLVQLYMNLF